jgi:hypothetical protein
MLVAIVVMLLSISSWLVFEVLLFVPLTLLDSLRSFTIFSLGLAVLVLLSWFFGD